VSFLNIALLSGLGAIAIPIIIHLLNRRTARRVEWGAMRFLLDSLRSRKKRIQLEEALLMAARCLLVALVVLCVARPLAEAGSSVSWAVVMPIFLLGVGLAAVTTVMWPEKRWRGKLLTLTVLLLALGVLAAGAGRWWPLNGSGSAGGRDVAVVVDGSMSMTLAPGGGGTNFEAAIREAEQVVNEAGRGTSFSLILGAPVPQAVLAQPLVNRAEVRSALDTLQPVNGRMAAFDALSLATLSLAQGRHPQKEIIVLTDGQDAGWELDRPARWESLQAGFSALKSPPRLIIRQFPLAANVRNLAVAGVRFSREVIGTDRPVVIDVSVTNTGGEAVTPGAVELTLDGTTLSDSSLGQIGPGATETIRFTHTFARSGGHVLRASVKVEDDLPGDDGWTSVVEVRSRLRVLIVDGSPGGPFLERASSFAALALAPGSLAASWAPAGAAGSSSTSDAAAVSDLIDPEVRAVASLASLESYAPYDAVILCDVAALAPSQARMLAGFVEAGGGLLLAPGVRADPLFYNGWQGTTGAPVAPVRLVQQVVVPDGGQVLPALTTFSHPALRVVADAKQSDLGSLVFSRYWQLSDNTSREPAVTIGARLATGEPLLAARQLGQGSVLSLAASLDSNGSNLPSRQAFVALLHELIYHLVDPGGQRLNRQPAYVVNVPLTRTRAATGLRGEYFRRSAPDVVVVSRIDPQLDFQWGQDAPAAGLAGDSFGVRWSGGLVARVSGDYTFHVEADDSADLTVNGQMLFEASRRKKERIKLQAGEVVPIGVVFRQDGGAAECRLSWESEKVPRQKVPSECLVPYLPQDQGDVNESSMGVFTAVGPDQQPRQVEIIRTPAGTLARLEQTVIPGLYQVTLPETARAGLQDLLTAEGTLAFTVVPDATEGVIKPLTDEAFAFFNRYAPTLRPSSANQVVDILAGRQYGEELWKYLAVGALFLLLAEIALTRWIARQRQSGTEAPIDISSRFEPRQAFTATVEKLRQAGARPPA
jgi:hypothetical protein